MNAVLALLPFERKAHTNVSLDWHLLTLVMVLLSVGLVMVASASMDFAATHFGSPWFFVKRHIVYLLLAISAALVVLAIPTNLWRRYGWLLFFVAIALLVAVLIPGIGRRVNGSQRWLALGPITIQASEVVKVCSIIFFASYLSNSQLLIQTQWKQLFKPLLMLLSLMVLLLMEPDFGGTVVLSFTVGGMLFLAGAKLWQCFLLLAIGFGSLASLAILSPYRLERLVTFLDPWKDQFDSGYQLTQSLIAFGRGEWLGLGLGNSIQKLLYLPEAHTDFIFSIFAEEYGFVGVILLLALFVMLIVRVFLIAKKAIIKNDSFIGIAVFGAGILLTCQVLINVGVASGFLPTKGLTLPFVSYGGSSLLMNSILIALLLRMDYDLEMSIVESPRSKQ